jgi:hypothetical protein
VQADRKEVRAERQASRQVGQSREAVSQARLIRQSCRKASIAGIQAGRVWKETNYCMKGKKKWQGRQACRYSGQI